MPAGLKRSEPTVAVHRGDDRARHAAERARDPGRRCAAGTRAAGAPAGASTRPRREQPDPASRRSRPRTSRELDGVASGRCSRAGLLRDDDAFEDVLGMRRSWADPGPSARAVRAADRQSSSGPATGASAGGRGSGAARELLGVDGGDVPREHLLERNGHGGRPAARSTRGRRSGRAMTSVPAARSPSRWSCRVATIETDPTR